MAILKRSNHLCRMNLWWIMMNLCATVSRFSQNIPPALVLFRNCTDDSGNMLRDLLNAKEYCNSRAKKTSGSSTTPGEATKLHSSLMRTWPEKWGPHQVAKDGKRRHDMGHEKAAASVMLPPAAKISMVSENVYTRQLRQAAAGASSIW